MNSENTQKLYEYLDKAVVNSMKRAGASPPCKAGCFWCCKEAVFCTMSEVRYLLESMTQEQVDGIRGQVCECVARFKNAGLDQDIEPQAVRYRSHALWCPLLKDGRCSVYSRRPSPCRTHFALKSKDACEHDELRLTQKFAVFVGLDEKMLKFAFDKTEPGEVEKMDHLVLLLYEAIFGVEVHSMARVHAHFEGEDLIVHKYDEESATFEVADRETLTSVYNLLREPQSPQ